MQKRPSDACRKLDLTASPSLSESAASLSKTSLTGTKKRPGRFRLLRSKKGGCSSVPHSLFIYVADIVAPSGMRLHAPPSDIARHNAPELPLVTPMILP